MNFRHLLGCDTIVLIRERKQKLIIFIHTEANSAIGVPVHSQAKLKYYFNYFDFLTGNVLFMTKFYFRSLTLSTDCLFPKTVRGKSSDPYECYLSRSKTL